MSSTDHQGAASVVVECTLEGLCRSSRPEGATRNWSRARKLSSGLRHLAPYNWSFLYSLGQSPEQ